MRPITGIDPSLIATGVAWPDGSTEVLAWPGHGVERLAGVYARIANWVDLGPLADVHPLVVLEGYAHGKGNQAHQMGELGGVMRLALHHCRVEVLVVPPAVVKKYATGKGNANKDLVRDAARDRLGPLAPGISSDECDALWLRQIGLRLIGDPSLIEVPKLHVSALDKLDTSTIEVAA